MSLFRNKRKEIGEENGLVPRPKEKLPAKGKFKDLAPENKKKRKEPVKPWGKHERMLVVGFLGGSILAATILAASARDWKLPGLPRIYIPELTLESTIVLEGNPPTAEAKFDGIKKAFEQRTEKLSGVYGFYVKRLTTGEEYGVNQNETFPIPEGETSPQDIGHLFAENWKNEEVLDTLGDESEAGLKKGLPSALKFVHKFGHKDHVIYDAGVVFWDKPFVIVVMGKGIVEVEANVVFPEISRTLYNFEINN